jgi:formylglycine-generating enzyme required for sulfatase activity
MINWRTQQLQTYSSAEYLKPGFEWVPSCYSLCFLMVYDPMFYNYTTGEYKTDSLLDYHVREFGGIDALLLWQAYPVVGIDQRNQFDFYRDMPGGLAGIKKDVVDKCHARGVKVFIDHNPWDSGTRREGVSDAQALAGIVKAIDADGIFLDTYGVGSGELRTGLDAIKPGIVLEGEYTLSNAADIAKQHMEWAQWTWGMAGSYQPGCVLANKWLERRHMIHSVDRLSTNHSSEVHEAWMNGTGMTVWENVFGTWVGWSNHDRTILRAATPIQRRYTSIFTDGAWTPMIPAMQSDVYVNLWEKDGLRLWTLVNNANAQKSGGILRVASVTNDRYFDLVAGTEITPAVQNGTVTLNATIGPRGIGSFLAGPTSALGADFAQFMTSQAHVNSRANFGTAFPSLPLALKRPAPTRKYAARQIPPGMVLFTGSSYSQTVQVDNRECGAYDNRGNNISSRQVKIDSIAVDSLPVTNAQYLAFLQASGYAPKHPENFLKHWTNGSPTAGTNNDPVVYVDLDDARAYAAWAQKRLPTEEEWQYAMESGRIKYGTKRVWEMNESERNDGRTRFCMLKGGCDWQAQGSGWYFPGGTKQPSYAAKMLLMWPGLSRCSTIGFRCVVDLNPSATISRTVRHVVASSMASVQAVNGGLHIVINAPGKYSISIMRLSGETVKVLRGDGRRIMETMTVDCSDRNIVVPFDRLAAGMCVVRISWQGGEIVRRLPVVR